MIITIDASAKERKSAKAAHELFTLNTIVVHIFLTLGLIKVFGTGMDVAISTSIILSLFIIAYTYMRTKKAKTQDVRLVYLHWQLSLNRYKLLIGAYIFYFLISVVGLLLGSDAPASMDGVSIVSSIMTLLGVVPLFFVVLVSVVLGSGSMFNAGRGEIDKKHAEKYPE